MAESTTIVTLRTKRDEIVAAIAHYEQKITRAKADLAHIEAVISIFDASGNRSTMSTYFDVKRLFRYGEALSLCKEALSFGPKTSNEIALFIMAAKNLDTEDRVLHRSMVGQLVQILSNAHRRGVIEGRESRKNSRIWRLPESAAGAGETPQTPAATESE